MTLHIALCKRCDEYRFVGGKRSRSSKKFLRMHNVPGEVFYRDITTKELSLIRSDIVKALLSGISESR